jgi:hypothetical protein
MKLLVILTFLLFSGNASAQERASLPDAASFVMTRDAAPSNAPPALPPDTPPSAVAPPETFLLGSSGTFPPDGDAAALPYSNPLPGTSPALHLDLGPLLAKINRPSTGSTFALAPDGTLQPLQERYHWKGLLWESFAFFGVENVQRFSADSYLRYLTADKPFWHDYIASLKQWNLRRWNDGDSFLVAYIAHPLQGSVTEFIQIQNSPRNRDYRINDGKPYWKSRLQSFYWATAFSTDQKLGPFGEAAFGSEGGYTYVIGCAYPCPTYYANPSQYQVTNNTGWVKLVSTPVVGTLWTVVEDGVDHFISDRVQGDRIHAVFPKILRGSLNPSRTMANLLRWRVPWYRDWQHDATNVYLTPIVHILPGDDQVILAAPKYEIFPHLDWISLPVNVNTVNCSPCRQGLKGYGFGFSRRIATYADLDSDVNFLAGASPLPSDRAGGDALSATFGFRSGFTARNFALKAYLRPGLLTYDRAYQSSPFSPTVIPPIGRITHFTVALGFTGDVYVNRHLGFRGVFGNQPVRYREPPTEGPGIGTYPYLGWLSTLVFATNENWTSEVGPILRF